MTSVFIFLIQIYRKTISPYLGSQCRFYPSCSVYAQEALEEKGFFQGIWLLGRRLLKCHPFHPGGYDPVESGT